MNLSPLTFWRSTCRKKLSDWYLHALALWDVGASWIIVVLAGIFFLAHLVLYIQDKQIADLQRGKLLLVLLEIREQIEADLTLGFELSDNERNQYVLENAISHDKNILAIQTLDSTGLVLFSTDRGVVGELASSTMRYAVLAATRELEINHAALTMRVIDAPWSAVTGSEKLLGIPLRNVFGEISGHLVATYQLPSSAGAAQLYWPLAIVLTLFFLIVTPVLWWIKGRLKMVYQANEFTSIPFGEQAALQLQQAKIILEKSSKQLQQDDSGAAHL